MTVNIDPHRLDRLHAMGIQLWVRREKDSCTEKADRLTAVSDGSDLTVAQLDWRQLEQQVAQCTACALHQTRTQAVFGVGDRQADWLIVGEAPGAEEDRQGEPFVGRAGQLLNAMLKAVDLERRNVYIANILKCRPPRNRDPLPQEVRCCEPFLKRQIELLQPRIILALGRVAAQNLLKTERRIGLLRGQRYCYADTAIPVIVTYHPAYLLRSPKEKSKAWDDLLFAQRQVAMTKA